jgi:hypothetical protein
MFGINNFDEKVRDFKQHFRKLKLFRTKQNEYSVTVERNIIA